MNEANSVWQEQLLNCLKSTSIVKPRGLEAREVMNGSYSIPMPAYLTLESRKVNLRFMLAEARWIITGSNRLSDISPHMKRYAEFSDDGVFLNGAYGVKVVEQLSYVVSTILKDNDSRQVVLTIWRERPAPSKDIPCTVAMQFLLRDNELHLIVTMRSQDVVLGFTYDIFTFSTVAKVVQCLLAEKGLHVELGKLIVNAGSLHLYDNYYDKAINWVNETMEDENFKPVVDEVFKATTYSDLIQRLKDGISSQYQ